MNQIVPYYASDREFMGTTLVALGSLALFSKGYGFANLESDVPDSPNTKFRLDP